MFKTLKAKLLLSFLLFFSITFGLVLTSLWFEYQQNKIQRILYILTKIELEVKNTTQLERDFFIDETINPFFYQRQQSTYLDERRNKVQTIKHYLDTLQSLEKAKQWQSEEVVIDSVEKALEDYERTFNKLVQLVLVRGFKDYGLEGEMRNYIHSIEQSPVALDKGKLLMMRRHEKDFILRKEPQYIEKLNQAVEIFQEEITNKVQDKQVQIELRDLLRKYHDTFIKLAKIESDIGFQKNQGMRGKLLDDSQKLITFTQILNQEIRHNIANIQEQISILFGVILFVGLLVLGVLSWRVTRWLSYPIQELSFAIQGSVQQRFTKSSTIPYLDAKDEIGQLARDFSFMLQTVQESLQNIENQRLTLQREKQLMLDSIQYAQQIQRAILPDKTELDYYFEEHYELYLPRDVVSGDFYWFAHKQNLIFWALVDCTGHGVPGAFMSMIGNTLLNKIVNENDYNDPAFILETLNLEVNMALHQEKSKNTDGMDIALLVIDYQDKQKPQVLFAGAKQNLLYLQHDKLVEIRGTRRSLGGSLGGYDKAYVPFETVELDVCKGDSIFLISDGFTDQPNAKRRKYGVEKLKRIIKECWHIPTNEQGERLKNSLLEHMEATPQRDDITLLIIKL